MDVVKEEDYDKADRLPTIPKRNTMNSIEELTDEKFKELLTQMQNPVEAQKELAVQIKHYLDNRIDAEFTEKGYLSDHTRRWVEAFNNILEKIQRALYGDKSVNLHLHKVSHSQVAAKMRKAKEIKKDAVL